MITLIAYSKENKEQLLEIFKQNIPTYFAIHELEEFSSYLDIMPESYLCIYSNDKLIGGIGYEIRLSGNSGRINWIFLHPTYFGKGAGKKAVLHCLEILSTQKEVKKYLVRTSQLVFPFFEKLGFKTNLIQKDYWAIGLDLYEMEKEK